MQKLDTLITIREIARKDLNDVLELRVRFALFEKSLDSEVEFNEEVKNRLKNELIDSFKRHFPYYFIVIRGKDIIGYINIYSYPDLPKVVYVGEFFVEKQFRGKGIGKKLLEAAFGFLKGQGIQEIRLNTYQDNKVGINFFCQAGFAKQNPKTILLSYHIPR